MQLIGAAAVFPAVIRAVGTEESAETRLAHPLDPELVSQERTPAEHDFTGPARCELSGFRQQVTPALPVVGGFFPALGNGIEDRLAIGINRGTHVPCAMVSALIPIRELAEVSEVLQSPGFTPAPVGCDRIGKLEIETCDCRLVLIILCSVHCALHEG